MSKRNFKICSMTAFAKSQDNSLLGRFSWEVRSVNQRYLEITPRLPDAFRHLENEIRTQLKAQLYRGKVEVSLSFEKTQSNHNLEINQTVLQPLVAAISEVQQAMPEATQVNPLDILNWPGVLQSTQNSVDQELLEQALLKSFAMAMQQLQAHRLREGQALAEHLLVRVTKIGALIQQQQPRLGEIVSHQTKKIHDRITQAVEEVDESRLHQEIALIAQKMDVTEELDRIQTHLQEVEHILCNNLESKPVGRRLDFLMQELNREANTLGSKSVDTELSQTSIELKVLIEQMREQVQNIE